VAFTTLRQNATLAQLLRWGEKDNLVSSTGLIMWIGHRILRDSNKMTFQALALRRSARNGSFRISLWWTIHIINPADKTKLSCYTPHRRNTTVPSLETYPLYSSRKRVWCFDQPDHTVFSQNLLQLSASVVYCGEHYFMIRLDHYLMLSGMGRDG